MDLRGKTALVTGASSGLGVEFAKQLAKRGADLVITARRRENLEQLKQEIEKDAGVRVSIVVLDLSEHEAPAKLFEEAERVAKIDVLVNNAGGGIHQTFLDIPWDRTLRQIQLNVVSLTELTWRFGRAMRERGGGHILNVSSIGAYTPSPTYATYSAGKAFVRDFSEAVAYELADTNVRVCSLCPGGTVTEFHLAAGHELPSSFRATFQSAAECAEVGLDALFAGRRNVISGWLNKMSMFMLRFVPRRTMVWTAALTMGEPSGAGDVERSETRRGGSHEARFAKGER
ncbi:MAG: SDR family oxidoreductase, partial [Polyangiaceae bacterium]|nr:SDR family oxidoreductase [Polyangiaceae bacterium]